MKFHGLESLPLHEKVAYDLAHNKGIVLKEISNVEYPSRMCVRVQGQLRERKNVIVDCL